MGSRRPKISRNSSERTLQNTENSPKGILYKAPYEHFQLTIGPLGGPRPLLGRAFFSSGDGHRGPERTRRVSNRADHRPGAAEWDYLGGRGDEGALSDTSGTISGRPFGGLAAIIMPPRLRQTS